MPRQPNQKNPVAFLRSYMGMKLTDFADFVGHGAAMLKHVESGFKPMPAELADKIHAKTGAPLEILLKAKITREDQERLTNIQNAASLGGPGSREVIEVCVSTFLPKIVALCGALLEAGINPRLGTIALNREIEAVLARWSIDRETFKRLELDAVSIGMRIGPSPSTGFTPFGRLVESLLTSEAAKIADNSASNFHNTVTAARASTTDGRKSSRAVDKVYDAARARAHARASKSSPASD